MNSQEIIDLLSKILKEIRKLTDLVLDQQRVNRELLQRIKKLEDK